MQHSEWLGKKNPQSVSMVAKYSKIRLKNPEYKFDPEAQDWK